MKHEKFIINLPVLRDYVYSILYNASSEEKKNLPPRYIRYMRSERLAKQFTKRSNLDEKLSLLSYFGINWFLVMVDEEVTGIKQLKQIMAQFKEDKKISSLKDIVNMKLFVTSSKEFSCLLGLMAQTIHHQAYKLNLEYTRTGYHVRRWSRRFEEGSGVSPDQTLEDSMLLAKTLLSTSLILETCDVVHRLTQSEIRILLYLYTMKHTYVDVAQIQDYFNGYETKVSLTRSLRSLVDTQHLQPSAIAKSKQYTITGIGIRAVTAFQESVIQANSFK